jgi:DNA-binding transcriptional regulator YdaS (Cro superfamily)
MARPDPAITQLRKERLLSAIARELKLTKQATSKWVRVPPHHVLAVAKITGKSPHFLRPDLYPKRLIQAAAAE